MKLKKVADLHVHTTASDGMVEPLQLIRMAEENGLSALAITDHDTFSGIKEVISQKNDFKLELISAAEISTSFEPIMHIVALFVDIENEKMNNMLNKINKSRKYLMVKAFGILSSHGINLNLRKVMRNEGILSVNALSDFLVREKYFLDRRAVDILFDEIWEEWKNILPTPKNCIDTIHQAGGIAILAHPVLLGLNHLKLKQLLLDLKAMGLDGVEINHPNQSNKFRKMMEDCANEMNFLKSGGSDYHGKHERDELATLDSDTAIPYENVLNMKQRIVG